MDELSNVNPTKLDPTEVKGFVTDLVNNQSDDLRNVTQTLQSYTLAKTQQNEDLLSTVYHPLTVEAAKQTRMNTRALQKITAVLSNDAIGGTARNTGVLTNLLTDLRKDNSNELNRVIDSLNSQPIANFTGGGIGRVHTPDELQPQLFALPIAPGNVVGPVSNPNSQPIASSWPKTFPAGPWNVYLAGQTSNGGTAGSQTPSQNGSGPAGQVGYLGTPSSLANGAIGKVSTSGEPLGPDYVCNPDLSKPYRINVWTNGSYCRCIATPFGDPGGDWRLVGTVDTKAECDALSLATCGTYPTGAFVCAGDGPPPPTTFPIPPGPWPVPKPVPVPKPLPGPQPASPPEQCCTLETCDDLGTEKNIKLHVQLTLDQLPKRIRDKLAGCDIPPKPDTEPDEVSGEELDSTEWLDLLLSE